MHEQKIQEASKGPFSLGMLAKLSSAIMNKENDNPNKETPKSNDKQIKKETAQNEPKTVKQAPNKSTRKPDKSESSSAKNSGESSSSTDSNKSGESDAPGQIRMDVVKSANEQYKENKKWADDKLNDLLAIEKDKELKAYFSEKKGLFPNFNDLSERETMFYSMLITERMMLNIEDFDYTKNMIDAYRCPNNPVFKRSKKDFPKMGLESLPEMEKTLSKFGDFYMQLVDILPKSLDSPFDVEEGRAKGLSFEIDKKLRKKSGEAKILFRSLDQEFGEDYIEMSKWQCDMKDFMNFHELLPRFFRLYKVFSPDVGNLEKPFVKFSVQRFRDMNTNWKTNMRVVFRSMEFINLIILYTKMLFYQVNSTDDPTTLIPMVKLFMNFYNIINFTLSNVYLLKKKMFTSFKKLKKHIYSVEKYYNLGNVPDPEISQDYEGGAGRWAMSGWVLLSALLLSWL